MTDDGAVLNGDFGNYEIARRGGMLVEFASADTEIRKRGFRAYVRDREERDGGRNEEA